MYYCHRTMTCFQTKANQSNNIMFTYIMLILYYTNDKHILIKTF